MSDYETIIGLEVHAQLLTASKMFCGCSADYASAPPNTHVCPVCMALPGVLPVINRAAVEKTIMAGLALNCTIAAESVFARKNYHYADLPKGYQISQYELPLCREGWLEIEVNGQKKRIGITRAHLEEDTGKLMHAGGHSLIDLNRAGVPLLEIVTEPDLRSAAEADAYLTKLQAILRYLGVSSADMEKGAMRCEANVSVRRAGEARFGTKVEVKNLNSFRAVRLALEYEVARHISTLDQGGSVEQVTMGWDDLRGRTVVQRTKESSADYRYFPEPDLPPLRIARAEVEALRAALPELPDAKAERFGRQFGLDGKEIEVLVADRLVAEYYENTTRFAGQVPPRTIFSWVSGELFRLMNASGLGIGDVRVSPQCLAELILLVENGRVNLNSAKRALDSMFQTGRSASEVVQELGLSQVSDEDELAAVVAGIVERYPEEVAKFREGKTQVVGWLMGQIMRETKGKANPNVVRELLERKLKA